MDFGNGETYARRLKYHTLNYYSGLGRRCSGAMAWSDNGLLK